jgi:hypothetical protein
MDDLKKIVEDLQEYPAHIHMATITMEDLRTEWENVKARKEYEFAKAFLEAKAADFTDGEAKQKAAVETYKTEMEVIVAESQYRKAVADMNKMENEFAAVRKNVGLQEAVILKLGTSLAQL